MRRLSGHHPHCLGCGDANPCSLGLEFSEDGGRVYTTMRLGERHTGAPGIAHGGAVATAFDDLLGTIPLLQQRPAVTARLDVTYRSPVFLDVAYEMEGWVETEVGRKMHLAGVARDADGVTVAECRALFVAVDRAHFERGGLGPPPW